MWYEVPLSGDNEQFSISILGVSYIFQVIYRGTPYNTWILNILDYQENALITGIPLVTGCDLMAQFSKSMGLPFSIFVATDGDPDTIPTESTLGSTSHMYVRT